MKQYLDLLRSVRAQGVRQPNRTGIDSLFTPAATLQFDLADGFPAVTTKKLAFRSVVGELVGFLRGYTNASDFRRLGCKVWDQNANENAMWLGNDKRKGHDDLGRIYGAQWRGWRGSDGTVHDQLAHVVRMIKEDPTDRRLLISAWRPDEFSEMALPPCHVLYQFVVDVTRRQLHMCMYQRGADLFLGAPFNIASSALLLSLVARLTDYTPRVFTHFIANPHIYVNHLDQVDEQLSREPLPLPRLRIDDRIPAGGSAEVEWLDLLEPSDFNLTGYTHHSPIRAPMAV